MSETTTRPDCHACGEPLSCVLCGAPALQVDIAHLVAENARLLAALKLVYPVLRPWIDGMVGQSGSVTFQQWADGLDQINAAIDASKERS